MLLILALSEVCKCLLFICHLLVCGRLELGRSFYKKTILIGHHNNKWVDPLLEGQQYKSQSATTKKASFRSRFDKMNENSNFFLDNFLSSFLRTDFVNDTKITDNFTGNFFVVVFIYLHILIMLKQMYIFKSSLYSRLLTTPYQNHGFFFLNLLVSQKK